MFNMKTLFLEIILKLILKKTKNVKEIHIFKCEKRVLKLWISPQVKPEDRGKDSYMESASYKIHVKIQISLQIYKYKRQTAHADNQNISTQNKNTQRKFVFLHFPKSWFWF